MKSNNTHDKKYNYSKLVDTRKQESQYISFSIFIDEKIHDLRNNFFDGEARKFNRYTLSKTLGMEHSTLTKIINGSQGTRKRDVIIGICFALRLTESEANQALDLYPMAQLNPYNLRDLVIIHALRDGLSVEELNETLLDHKMPKLNLVRGDGKKEDRGFYYPYDSTAYEEENVDIVPYCIDEDSSALSLHERYHPERYDYESTMVIRNKEDPMVRYRLRLDSGERYTISMLTDDGERCLYSDDYFRKKYDNVCPCDDPDLLNEVTKLKEYTVRKARYVHSMCNDTRNYKVRFDAINDNGTLVIYGESFNFDSPELNEYYQIEVSINGCVFTVTNSSRFMERYLGEASWMKLYGTPLSQPTRTYTALGDVADERRKHFANLLDCARDLVSDLQNKKLFLFNAKAWLDIDDLMHLFKVEEQFDCYQPEDSPYDALPRKEEIIGLDGNPITVDDLWRAAELDIASIEELCSARERYGSLEKFLDIDALDGHSFSEKNV